MKADKLIIEEAAICDFIFRSSASYTGDEKISCSSTKEGKIYSDSTCKEGKVLLNNIELWHFFGQNLRKSLSTFSLICNRLIEIILLLTETKLKNICIKHLNSRLVYSLYSCIL